MKTDELIHLLAADERPVQRTAIEQHGMRNLLEQTQAEPLCVRIVRIDARPHDYRTRMIGRNKVRRDTLLKRAHHERWPPYLQDETVLGRRSMTRGVLAALATEREAAAANLAPGLIQTSLGGSLRGIGGSRLVADERPRQPAKPLVTEDLLDAADPRSLPGQGGEDLVIQQDRVIGVVEVLKIIDIAVPQRRREAEEVVPR